MATRKPEEMKVEADKLAAMRDRVVARTAFGDDNRAAIDAQVEVLREDINEGRIYDRYGDDENLLDSALEARRWIDGEGGDESPSKGWEVLIRH